MTGTRDLARRLRSPGDLTAIDPLRSLDQAARRSFADPRLVQWVGRYATYSGSSPYRAPAALACIPAVEARYGVWYPRGGMGALRDALVRVAERVGVDAGDRRRRRGRGDRGRTGGRGPHRRRAAAPRRRRRGQRGRRAPLPRPVARPAGAASRQPRRAVDVGLRGPGRGPWPHPRHRPPHGVVLRTIRPGSSASSRTTAPSRTTRRSTPASRRSPTPRQAPPGDENWFILVNAPHHATVDADAHRDLLLDRLAGRGVDLRDRLRFTETITPQDLAARYRAPGGSIYGTSSNGRRAAFLRPANRGPRRGLYLVGGSSHPGGGLPLVAMSARIVADLVREDRW